jgi:hypothetical protein
MGIYIDSEGVPVGVIDCVPGVRVPVDPSGLYQYADGSYCRFPPKPVIALGFAGRSVDDLALTLQGNYSRCKPVLVDIRLVPVGPSAEWSAEALLRRFGRNHYRHVPELGDRNFADAYSRVDIADPVAGIRRLRLIIAEGVTPVLICSCGDRTRHGRPCHRFDVIGLLAAPPDVGLPILVSHIESYDWRVAPVAAPVPAPAPKEFYPYE